MDTELCAHSGDVVSTDMSCNAKCIRQRGLLVNTINSAATRGIDQRSRMHLLYPFHLSVSVCLSSLLLPPPPQPQWGAADAEIKVPALENTELEGSPFTAWGRSIYI